MKHNDEAYLTAAYTVKTLFKFNFKLSSYSLLGCYKHGYFIFEFTTYKFSSF